MSRIEKTLDILLAFIIILIGPHVFVTMAFFNFLADYMVPWGFSNTIVLGVLIWLLLFQENYQLRDRLLWSIMSIPTLSLIKFCFDHGWITAIEFILGKIPVVGEWVQKVELAVNIIALVPCMLSLVFDIGFVLIAGKISGKIPVTNLKSSWYQTLTIMKGWLPWNRD